MRYDRPDLFPETDIPSRAPESTVSDRTAGALPRLVASIFGVGLTTLIGSTAVVALYYPLRDAGVTLQWLLVFFLMTFESAAVHLPSEVILPVGGWQIVKEHSLGAGGVLLLSLVAATGNTCGSCLLYVAGRYGGRPLVRRYGRFLLLYEHDLDRAEKALADRRVWALLLTRVLPVIRTYAGFCAGMLRFPIEPFVVLTFVGSFVWCLPFVALGAALGENWGVIEGPAKIVGLGVLIVLVGFLVLLTVRQLKGRDTLGRMDGTSDG